ncbi:LysR family transcriptional regulator substrate-binding protein [Bacillus niameyensis]|uniref:LysR family transcriptional regulator substrate-binding protein n=1 Tax=Bacillus niameyensis TaxID=1522308 RepID=UPI00078039BE|nr:LysR family transcriptional regulator substrate-binding protein [Bacillus niameyensis]
MEKSLFPQIHTFQKIYPEIKIKLQHGSTPHIIEKLENGLIDIGIIHLPINNNEIHMTDYLTISSTFIVGEKYKELANKTLALDEMLNYPIISFSKTSSSRKFLNQIFQRKGLCVKPDVEVGSVELLIECAKIGMGIAFVTRELVLRELSKGELFEVHTGENIEKRQIGIITKKESPLSISANKFFKHLLE